MKPLAVFAVALASAACGAAVTGWVVNSGRKAEGPGVTLAAAGNGVPAAVPLGGLGGGLAAPVAGMMANPLGKGPDVVAHGRQLFGAMNCAGCHGYDGSGGMGPPLNDSYWRYGGSPVEIFKSLYEGRPKGMPAWGHALPESDLWELTAFVQSLGQTPIAPAAAAAARAGDEAKGDTAKAAAPALEGQ